MSQRKLIWHIGVADAPRALIAANLKAHDESLEGVGVQVVASSEEAQLATHELLRTHRQVGLSRADVEGRWAKICDRVWQHKGVSLVSTPDLCAADKDQLRLALDPLIGIEVHLVLTLDSFSQQLYGGWLAELRAGRTTGWDKYATRVLSPKPDHRQAEQFWAGHDPAAVLTRWGWTFHADRLHVVASLSVERHWLELLDIAGVSADGLAPVVPSYAAPAGVAVLRMVNRELEDPLTLGSVELLTSAEREISAMPVAPTASLAPLADGWTETLASAGHNLRGDLAALVDHGEGTALPGPREQLGVAVDALAEALAENSRLRTLVAGLEADRDHLDRKRRKWKRLAKQAPALAG